MLPYTCLGANRMQYTTNSKMFDARTASTKIKLWRLQGPNFKILFKTATLHFKEYITQTTETGHKELFSLYGLILPI
jgi:hypothetical protein